MKKVVLFMILTAQLCGTITLNASKAKKGLYCAGLTYLAIKGIGLGCDISNVVLATSRPTRFEAFPSNVTLPDDSGMDCTYELSRQCEPEVVNPEECIEYLADEENDGYVIIEECVGEKETDSTRFDLGFGSFSTRLTELIFGVFAFFILEKGV